MIFFSHNNIENFEEEEEEELEGGIDDALLGELSDDVLDDEALLAEELDPLLKSPLDEIVGEDEEDPVKEEGPKFFDEEEEDEDVDDYDSFDDHDEM